MVVKKRGLEKDLLEISPHLKEDGGDRKYFWAFGQVGFEGVRI